MDSHQYAGVDWKTVLSRLIIVRQYPSSCLPGVRAKIGTVSETGFFSNPNSRNNMTDLNKRSLIKAAALSAIAAAALAGCGKKEEPAPVVVVPAAPAAVAVVAPAKAEPLKIAFAYVGPVGDGGWTFAHDVGRKALEKEYGDKIVTSFVENVPEGADAERVLRDMVSQGNKLIFGTTFGYMEPMLKVAADSKGVMFEHATGFKQAENMRTYDSRTYEGAYMAGVIAGKMTKTNTLGVVASVPIPEVLRNINSFTLGAQSSNPKIKTKVVWVNEWFSPPKETEAATALINGGADVLFQNTDSPAVLKTAQDKGKRAFGWDSDMSAYGPKAHLASAVINWAPYYIKSTKEALDGTWKGGGGSWWGVKEGAIDLVSIADDVPAETKAKIDEIKAGLKAGTFNIWKGPIMGSDGKEVLAKDVVADDKFLSGLNFYVKGVEGKVPASK
jgi:basic membrane protein A